jgi:hypothetical protein
MVSSNRRGGGGPLEPQAADEVAQGAKNSCAARLASTCTRSRIVYKPLQEPDPRERQPDIRFSKAALLGANIRFGRSRGDYGARRYRASKATLLSNLGRNNACAEDLHRHHKLQLR